MFAGSPSAYDFGVGKVVGVDCAGSGGGADDPVIASGVGSTITQPDPTTGISSQVQASVPLTSYRPGGRGRPSEEGERRNPATRRAGIPNPRAATATNVAELFGRRRPVDCYRVDDLGERSTSEIARARLLVASLLVGGEQLHPTIRRAQLLDRGIEEACRGSRSQPGERTEVTEDRLHRRSGVGREIQIVSPVSKERSIMPARGTSARVTSGDETAL